MVINFWIHFFICPSLRATFIKHYRKNLSGTFCTALYARRFLFKFRSLDGAFFYNHVFLWTLKPFTNLGKNEKSNENRLLEKAYWNGLKWRTFRRLHLNEIQNSFTEISPALSLKSLNLLRPPEQSYLIQPDDPEPPVVPKLLRALCWVLWSSTKTKKGMQHDCGRYSAWSESWKSLCTSSTSV